MTQLKKDKQCILFAQAKRLKELGIEQIGLFCFNHPQDSYIPNWQNEGYSVKLVGGDCYGSWEHFSILIIVLVSCLIITTKSNY